MFERCVDLLGGLDNALTLLMVVRGGVEVVFWGIWNIKQICTRCGVRFLLLMKKMTIMYSGIYFNLEGPTLDLELIWWCPGGILIVF